MGKILAILIWTVIFFDWRAFADSNFGALLSRVQSINELLGSQNKSRSCSINEEKLINFCTSPYDFICKDVARINEMSLKGHTEIDQAVMKALIDRNASGNLEMFGNKLPAGSFEGTTENSLRNALQDESHESHFMLSYNYIIAANDIFIENPDFKNKMQEMLEKTINGIKLFIENSDRFKNCKDKAISVLSRVKFADLRESGLDHALDCGGNKLTENVAADARSSEIKLCPGIVKVGIISKNYEYLIPILAHEIGHLLVGALEQCYPHDCISQLPGGYMLDEKYAEWFAVKALPYIQDKQGNPSNTNLERMLFEYGQFICREPEANLNTYSSHPSASDRLNVFYGEDKRISEIMNCPEKKSAKSCN
jgi:hypothetical protein